VEVVDPTGEDRPERRLALIQRGDHSARADGNGRGLISFWWVSVGAHGFKRLAQEGCRSRDWLRMAIVPSQAFTLPFTRGVPRWVES
jgi:hypothetical protein